MQTKISVGILGATGIVGQRFVQMLERHPWFEVAWLAASDRSEGRKYADAARYVLALQQLPLGRVVNDARVDDHHAIIPTDVEHDVTEFTPDERRVFDLVARRFLAVFHPPARYARTTIVTLVEDERFRTRGKVTLEEVVA